MDFKIQINEVNLTAKQSEKVKLAARKIVVVVNSDNFKQFVLNFSWEQKVKVGGMLWWKKYEIKKHNKFWSTRDSNEQVYQTIMKGAEVLDPEVDYEADIVLQVDPRNRRGVIGYTYPNTKVQYVYKWAIDSFSADDLAGNIMHEWCHKLGYGHEFNRTAERMYSVPYQIGDYIANYRI